MGEEGEDGLPIPSNSDYKACIKLLKQTKNVGKLIDGCKKCRENVKCYLSVGGALQPLVALITTKQKVEVVEEVLDLIVLFLDLKREETDAENSGSEDVLIPAEVYISESSKAKSTCLGLSRFLDMLNHEQASVSSKAIKVICEIIRYGVDIKNKVEESPFLVYSQEYALQVSEKVDDVFKLLHRENISSSSQVHALNVLELIAKMDLPIIPGETQTEEEKEENDQSSSKRIADSSTLEHILQLIKNCEQDQEGEDFSAERAGIGLLFYLSQDFHAKTILEKLENKYIISKALLREFKRNELSAVSLQVPSELDDDDKGVKLEDELINCVVGSISSFNGTTESTSRIACLCVSRLLACSTSRPVLQHRRKLLFKSEAPVELLKVLLAPGEDDDSEVTPPSNSERSLAEHALLSTLTYSKQKYDNCYISDIAEEQSEEKSESEIVLDESDEYLDTGLLIRAIQMHGMKQQFLSLRLMYSMLLSEDDELMKLILKESFISDADLYSSLISVLAEHENLDTVNLLYAAVCLQKLIQRLSEVEDKTSAILSVFSSCTAWSDLVTSTIEVLRQPQREIPGATLEDPLLSPIHLNFGLDQRWKWTPTLEERYALLQLEEFSNNDPQQIYAKYEHIVLARDLPWVKSVSNLQYLQAEIARLVSNLVDVDVAVALLQHKSDDDSKVIQSLDEDTNWEEFKFIPQLLSVEMNAVKVILQAMSKYQENNPCELETLLTMRAILSVPKGRNMVLKQCADADETKEDEPEDTSNLDFLYTESTKKSISKGLEDSILPLVYILRRIENEDQVLDSGYLEKIRLIFDILIALCMDTSKDSHKQSGVSDLFCRKILEMRVLPIFICLTSKNSIPESQVANRIQEEAITLVQYLVSRGVVHSNLIAETEKQIDHIQNEINILNNQEEEAKDQVDEKQSEIEALQEQINEIAGTKPTKQEWAKLLNCSQSLPRYNVSNETPLGCAIRFMEADDAIVSSFLVAEVNVNTPDDNGVTPLMRALSCGCDEIAKLIVLQGKADVDAVDKSGDNVLKYAFVSPDREELIHQISLYKESHDQKKKIDIPGKMRIVSFLLKQGADPNVSDLKGNYPIHWLCGTCEVSSFVSQYCLTSYMDDCSQEVEQSRIETLRLLVESGAELNACNIEGSTAVHEAIKQNSATLCFELIEHGAFVNVLDIDGNLPLHFLCVGTCTEASNLMEKLLEKGDGKHLLHGAFVDRGRGLASKHRVRNRVRSILDRGLREVLKPSAITEEKLSFQDLLNLKNKSGWKALHVISSGDIKPHSNYDIVLSAKNTRTVDDDECEEKSSARLDLLRLIISKCCVDINSTDTRNRTPLILLAQSLRRNHKLVEVMIQAGKADVHRLDDRNLSAMHYFLVSGQEDAVLLLCKHGELSHFWEDGSIPPILLGAKSSVSTPILQQLLNINSKSAEPQDDVEEKNIDDTVSIDMSKYVPNVNACGDMEILRRYEHPNEFSGTAVMIAASEDDQDNLNFFLSIPQVNLDSKRGSDGYTALHLACLNNKSKNAELLLQAGAQADAVDLNGESPLFSAIRGNNDSLVAQLVLETKSFHSQVNLENSEGKSALEVAESLNISLTNEYLSEANLKKKEILEKNKRIVKTLLTSQTDGDNSDNTSSEPEPAWLSFVPENTGEKVRHVKHTHDCFSYGVMYEDWLKAEKEASIELEKQNFAATKIQCTHRGKKTREAIKKKNNGQDSTPKGEETTSKPKKKKKHHKKGK